MSKITSCPQCRADIPQPVCEECVTADEIWSEECDDLRDALGQMQVQLDTVRARLAAEVDRRTNIRNDLINAYDTLSRTQSKLQKAESELKKYGWCPPIKIRPVLKQK
jgi:chromosome segregation ATPase